jgi:FAD-dependent oxidoreductase domain-containing protein 1
MYRDCLSEPIKPSDIIIICAGYRTREVALHFGIYLPIFGDKHSVFHVQNRRPAMSHLPLIADLASGIYLRPEGTGYIVGFSGNSEGEANDLEPNWPSWDVVWQLLYHRFPTLFYEAKMVGGWAGYYDSYELDHNTIIDHRDGIYFTTGFTGRGLMHSPAVGLAMSQLVLGEKPLFELDSYRLDRLPRLEKYVI